MSRVRIGEMLVKLGRLDPSQLQAALAHQRQWGGRLGGAIVRLGFLGEPAVLDALGQQLGVPFVEIGDRVIPPKVLALVPRKLAQARRVLPLELSTDGRRGLLLVALGDPADLAVIDELAFVTGLRVKPALASDEDLDRALERHMGIAPRPRAPRGFAARTDAIELGPSFDGPHGRSGKLH
jgi:Type II secretion system (T2SS), protein E, N-terminal domain